MAYMRVTQRSAAMNCNMDIAVFYPMPDDRKSIEQIREEKRKRCIYYTIWITFFCSGCWKAACINGQCRRKSLL